jgi:hypothetical protein
MLFGGRWERNGRTDPSMDAFDQLVLESRRSTDERRACTDRNPKSLQQAWRPCLVRERKIFGYHIGYLMGCQNKFSNIN